MNVPLLFLRKLGLKKIAFWGHGWNWRTNSNGLAEWFKERTLTGVDWWFAYTSAVTEFLTTRGVPASRITTLNNAIDTLDFRRSLASVAEEELTALRRNLGLK